MDFDPGKNVGSIQLLVGRFRRFPVVCVSQVTEMLTRRLSYAGVAGIGLQENLYGM